MRNVLIPTFLRACFWILSARPLTPESYETCNGSYHKLSTQILEPKKDSLVIRMFIRLTVLLQHGQLAPGQWKTILALQPCKDSLGTNAKTVLLATDADITDVRLVKEVTGCNLSEHDLQHLYSLVSTTSS